MIPWHRAVVSDGECYQRALMPLHIEHAQLFQSLEVNCTICLTRYMYCTHVPRIRCRVREEYERLTGSTSVDTTQPNQGCVEIPRTIIIIIVTSMYLNENTVVSMMILWSLQFYAVSCR